MRELHNEYPHYGFDAHVGYGTRAHWEALRRHGPCAIHRLTFRGVRPDADSDDSATEAAGDAHAAHGETDEARPEEHSHPREEQAPAGDEFAGDEGAGGQPG
jgi:hypothetical protein